ncbi:MAG: sigma-70 family RNA polymerase sigma factor [Rhodospirillales bacterium]|nr:sigma-70 family RNA polymerase sigma factor [Rhodospirillales bacterium]MCW8862110.1 sigma-70 family RNA polymerase sigma factor [Rhodospirillales bacterium]MCW8952132.1 sigma-70 family RNA polymerase sigma factor [Rhodospirillales bacterium]MCW9001786.1 sigma-70 family RNA polymerase sigma factor [Rhodospirillales bacterium]MCW9040707.1 sigma-70 family RNA polymerase sigma factor [Rhodospirillales bacterium]
MVAALAGDTAAFGAMAERLYTRVYRFILRNIPHPDEAEDLTQDTFLEAYRKLSSFQGASKVSTWIMGIALNIARNHRTRAPRHRYQWTSDEVLETIAHASPTPYESAEVAAFAQSVSDGLESLSEDLREAVTLVSLEGLSYEDAAAATGIPVGTMKTRVFRARRILRENLEKEGKLHLLEP